VNYLADQAQARPFWDQAAADMSVGDYAILEATILGGVVSGPFAATVRRTRQPLTWRGRPSACWVGRPHEVGSSSVRSSSGARGDRRCRR
jgi:hypothetical protein